MIENELGILANIEGFKASKWQILASILLQAKDLGQCETSIFFGHSRALKKLLRVFLLKR